MDAFFADLVGPAANLQRQAARVHNTALVLSERLAAFVSTDLDTARTCKRLAEAAGVPEWIVAPSLLESLAARRISIGDAADAASRAFVQFMQGLIDSRNAFGAIEAQLERRREATDDDRRVMREFRRAALELERDPIDQSVFFRCQEACNELFSEIDKPPTAAFCPPSELSNGKQDGNAPARGRGGRKPDELLSLLVEFNKERSEGESRLSIGKAFICEHRNNPTYRKWKSKAGAHTEDQLAKMLSTKLTNRLNKDRQKARRA